MHNDAFNDRRRTQSHAGQTAGFEAPTLIVAAAIYSGFGALTWFATDLPWWVLLPVGGYLVAWHGSLQHEVVHGHPTPARWFNELLVLPTLGLWMPYRIYRETHLTHHRDQRLTDPVADPESFYVTAESWARAGRIRRQVLSLHNTLPGRLILGPLVAIWQLYSAEIALLLRGDWRHVGAWLWHGVGCALVLLWVMGVCGMSLWSYLLLFVLPGLSLTLLRSFIEHRADRNVARRTAIVDCHPLWAILFLNNNLHVVHHARPAEPWYRLPQIYRQDRAYWLSRNGGFHFDGYGAVARRYWLRKTDTPLHPAYQIQESSPTAGHRLISEAAPAAPVD